MVPWQYESFALDSHRDRLLEIHRAIQATGAFETHEHRMLLEARKP
jgi:hypothetical protein